jgi:membrane-associated phospholipid phosphatase
MFSFAFALVGFLIFPLAPPRMLADHFVDTIKVFGPAFYASREFANLYNPYAAMPSPHFSWTLMFGVLFLRTPNVWVKILGVIYPVLTLVAITVTANHYIMDAIGGGLLIAASFAVMELVNRRRRFLPKALQDLRLPWQRRLQSRRISEEQERS